MTKRIIVIGSGFAGLWSALSAMRLIELNGGEKADIEVTVVAPEPFLNLRPRFYEANSASMNTPLSDIFHVAGIQFVQGIVDTIRSKEHEIEVVDQIGQRSTLNYDRLILATGSHLMRPDIPGLRKHAFSIDRRDEAADFEAHLHRLASLPSTPARNTVVVCGGGFTGIEIAAELPARLRSILGEDANVRVVIVERAKEIGPDLGPGPRPVITQAFTELGVEMKLGAAVTSIDDKGVVTATGERIEALSVVWTAGLQASALTQQIPGKRDGLGRLHVDQDLRAPFAKEIFVAGDVAYAATDEKGHYALMSCQHAMPQGRIAGYNVAADLLGIELRPYSQPVYGTCLDLGPWGSCVSDGWDRQVKYSSAEAKPIKQWINGTIIYPPKADKVELFAAADPDNLGPTLS